MVDQHAPTPRVSYFRFYEELNDFLPQQLRKHLFSYSYIGKPSVKDTVEAIGVPHTEIDLIVIDGVSVTFDYKLKGDERVSVYPVFELLDISPITHLRPKPLRDTKFVVDVNLGKLALKLRLLGFDTLYNNQFEDSEIVDISLRENRIILTRDKGIFKYSAVTHGYWVRSDNIETQVKEVLHHLQLENSLKPFTRCTYCNSELNPIDKFKLKGRVPDNTLQFFPKFFECQGCKKIYWKGTHYKRIVSWLNELTVNNSIN
ncbi:Mut7-C RNAse domain-containing protein [Photobacterium alginatilyticum]|uniref:Twitching motility protein PilT n=1 Tax=Photobacterium alginatilyticum TaxID=1775171 RepID=A0ABW9YE35_9GAMM|nr:Mut7-C RNAse domain-containing protein [Photobacterium alginatilyticum]NBI52050.1 twitching motility protein PilT [Photobacterium alginatilyticum]